MWPSGGGGGQYGYWPQQWAQPGYGVASNHPTPQDTDPTEWAAKAVQWAQQRQIQERYFQQLTQWQQPSQQQQQQQQPQQQQVQPQVAPPVEQPPMAGEQQVQFQQHAQLQAPQAEQHRGMETVDAHRARHGMEPHHVPSSQPLPQHAGHPPGRFNEPPRGPGEFRGGRPNFHPRGDFGGPRGHQPRHDFQPQGGPPSDFQFQGGPGGRGGGFRPRGRGGFEPRERRPAPFQWERGERPMHPAEGKFEMEADRESLRPRAPTEEMFDRGEEAPGHDFPNRFQQPPERREDLRRKFESDDRNFGEAENYREGRFQIQKEGLFREREREAEGEDGYGGRGQKFGADVADATETQEEEEWLYSGQDESEVRDSRLAEHRFGAGGGDPRGLEHREKTQEQLYRERQQQYGEDFKHREKKSREHLYHESRPLGEERDVLGLEGREKSLQEQVYRKEQHFVGGEPESRLEPEHHLIAEERELEREKRKQPEARERIEATVPSLRKETTVIPGLGTLGNETSSGDAQNREPNSNKQEKETNKEEGPGPTNQMIESLGKIVSQLQTLQGLTSSLQLLQNMPKGQEAASKEAEAEKEKEAATAMQREKEKEAATAMQREKELSEETKRKVEALLANESDSEGEQDVRAGSKSVKEMAPVVQEAAHGKAAKKDDSSESPPAREFDGTFDVKPRVYGTYTNQDEFSERKGEYRGEYRGEGERYYEYKGYPPRQSSYEQEREKYRDYDYHRGGPPRDDRDYPPYPPAEGTRPSRGDRDYPYPPEHDRQSGRRFESHDYGHVRQPHYDDRPPPLREARPERDYPPGEHHRGPPPQTMRGGGEADQYYEPRPAEKSQAEEEEDEKESKAGIISQMETIDYSHGGVLPNVQTVDYHHGQASRGEDPSYHERPPPVRVHDYPSGPHPPYDRPPDYPPPGYPPYPGFPPEGFPPGPPGMFPYPPYGRPGSYFPPGFDPAALFAAYTEQAGEMKRKTLPLWLREALEKMERDRQKKEAKETKDSSRRESSGRPTWRDELDKEEEERDREEGGKPRAMRSYRYKSPSKEEHSPPRHKKRSLVAAAGEEEEDKQLNMIMRIRKMLTEILLEVTNQEIQTVAGEALEEALKPKFAFQMKPQQKLQQKDNVLGLTIYASESDSGDSDDDTRKSKSKKSKVPVVDVQAIFDAFKDTPSAKDEGGVEETTKDRKGFPVPREVKQRRWEKGPSTSEKEGTAWKLVPERVVKIVKEREKEKEKEKASLKRESRRVSEEKGREKEGSGSKWKALVADGGSKEKERQKESASGSSKHSASSTSSKHSSSRSKRRSSSPSPHRSASKQSKSPSKSATSSSTKKSSSSKSSSSKEGKGRSPGGKSSGPQYQSPSAKPTHSKSSQRGGPESRSPAGRKRSRSHQNRSRSPSPPPAKGSRSRGRSRSRSRSPNRSDYSKWSKGTSSPTATASRYPLNQSYKFELYQ